MFLNSVYHFEFPLEILKMGTVWEDGGGNSNIKNIF